MRPDGANWRTTNMVATEFLPKRLLAGQYVFWVAAAVLLQGGLAAAGFAAMTRFDMTGPWRLVEPGAGEASKNPVTIGLALGSR